MRPMVRIPSTPSIVFSIRIEIAVDTGMRKGRKKRKKRPRLAHILKSGDQDEKSKGREGGGIWTKWTGVAN